MMFYVYRTYDRERQRLVTEALIARINTREASTLVFSTVAASASLLFLVPIYQNGTISSEWIELMKWLGFLFSFLGLVYREITIHTSDHIDYQVLRARLGVPLPRPQWLWIIVRGSIIRFFLILPIAAWGILLFANPACSSITLASAFILSVLFSVCELLSRDP